MKAKRKIFGIKILSILHMSKKSSKFAGKFDIRRDLSALQSQGIIRRVGPDRGGHWEIIEQQ